MRIKRIFIVMLLMVAGVVNAQSQQGYVKTKGRLGSNGAVIKGTRLSDAMVTVKGRYAVVSGNNGTFALTIPGNSYFLLNALQQFAEAGVIPRKYEADVEKIKKMLNE